MVPLAVEDALVERLEEDVALGDPVPEEDAVEAAVAVAVEVPLAVAVALAVDVPEDD